MAPHFKAGWCHRLQATRTERNIVKPIAFTTVKMVHVAAICNLIAHTAARDFDRLNPFFFDERFQVAVERGETQSWDRFESLLMELFHAQWMVAFMEES